MSCMVLTAEEKLSLRAQIQDAVEKGSSMSFGQNHVKRVVYFELLTRDTLKEVVIEPLWIYISDEVRLGSTENSIEMRMLRPALKFYRQGCEAAGERPWMVLFLADEADDDLVRRAINVMTEPGQNEVLIAFEVRQVHPPKPIIPKKPTPPKLHPYFSCLVHNCQVCGNRVPYTPVPEFPSPNVDQMDVGPDIEFGSPELDQPKGWKNP